jgi:N-acetylglucosaminyl-diphospho-decaprenol L-rhamnosyltransferase
VPTNDSIAIVLVTHQRRAQVLKTLAFLATLPERPAVVLVDNGSVDGTAEAVSRRFPSVRVVSLDENIGVAARNIGVESVSSQFVALNDDDSWWDPGALARAADIMRSHPELGLVAARILVGPEGKLDPTCARMARGPREEGVPGRAVVGFIACACVVRKSAFIQAGGFHRRYGIGGEERLLALDLMARGWQLAYVDDVVARHHPSVRPNSHQRATQIIRNDLWTTWLRMGPAEALAGSLLTLLPGSDVRGRIKGFSQAVRGLPWVLSERAPAPPDVRRRYRRVAR